MQDYNWIDYIILAVFFLSIFVGFARGFLKEIISLGTWVAAFLIASKFASPLAEHFAGASNAAAQSAFGNSAMGATAVQSLSMLSIVISFIVIFMGVLFVGSMLGYIVTNVASGTGLGLINRLLGAVFGGARGYVITVILIFIAQLTPLGFQPVWGQSQLVPPFEPAVTWVSNIASPQIQAIQMKARGIYDSVSTQLPNVGSLFQSFHR